MRHFPVPDCLIRELEFAERHCGPETDDIFFPIRFLWAIEANEQRLFNLPALGRSGYHTEKLLRLWQRSLTDVDYRRELEREGAQFDFGQRAIKLPVGWFTSVNASSKTSWKSRPFLGSSCCFLRTPEVNQPPHSGQ